MKLSRHLIFLTPLLLIACSSSIPYYKNESKALNIVYAGGIYDSDIHDSEDGMKSYGKSFLMQALNFASLATSFQGSAIGLSGGATFLANSASILATPENASARPSLMAWIPDSSAEDKFKARDISVNHIQTALTNTASDMKISIEKLPRGQKDPVINKIPLDFWEVTAPEHGCQNGQCVVAIYINKPYEVDSPEFLKETIGKKCYALSAGGRKDYSRIIFYQAGKKTFPEKDFYQMLSKNLPVWTALYFPPNSIHQKGEPLSYPVVFEKGEMLLFKKPKS